MANQRLINFRALLMAQEILDSLGACLREEERRDAFDVFFRLCKSGLESFCVEQERMQRRLKPNSN